jgi:hypothetical protein
LLVTLHERNGIVNLLNGKGLAGTPDFSVRGPMTNRDIERLKEQIKYETEILKMSSLVTVAIGGGSISLMLGEQTPLRLGLAGLGLIGTLALGVVLWRWDRRIRAILLTASEIKEDL